MARNRRKKAPTLPPRWEYPLRHFAFADDTPMATVISDLREPVLRAILEVRYHIADRRSLVDAIDCKDLFIGHSQDDHRGCSRIRVKYRLVRLLEQAKGDPVRKFSRSHSLSAWIGRGSAGGVSLYWREHRE